MTYTTMPTASQPTPTTAVVLLRRMVTRKEAPVPRPPMMAKVGTSKSPHRNDVGPRQGISRSGMIRRICTTAA